MKKFGQSMGQTIEQAALFGRSWSDAFKAITVELIQLILKMTLLKSLQQSAAGGSGVAGFFGSLLSGFTGHAAGGPVYQGAGYLVGERGPEWFSPSTSGYIVPNSELQGRSGRGAKVEHNEFHFHGVTDMDSFKKSESQLAASMAAALTRHGRRNG